MHRSEHAVQLHAIRYNSLTSSQLLYMRAFFGYLNQTRCWLGFPCFWSHPTDCHSCCLTVPVLRAAMIAVIISHRQQQQVLRQLHLQSTSMLPAVDPRLVPAIAHTCSVSAVWIVAVDSRQQTSLWLVKLPQEVPYQWMHTVRQ